MKQDRTGQRIRRAVQRECPEREAKLKALRTMLDASIAAGGAASDADINSALEAKAAQLARAGSLTCHD